MSLSQSYRQDYPPQKDFKSTPPFSEIYKDIESNLPAPDITRLDGCRNVSAYFPNGKAKPDLG